MMQAQTPALKPGPELNKLNVLVGHWRGEGEFKPGPFGPGGQYSFEETDEMILGGFFLQSRATFKETALPDVLWIVGYDPANKNYLFSAYQGDGNISSGTGVFEGNLLTLSGKFSVAGKQYLTRNILTVAADLMSITAKLDLSSDGKTWIPLTEEKITKIEPRSEPPGGLPGLDTEIRSRMSPLSRLSAGSERLFLASRGAWSALTDASGLSTP